MYRVHVHDVLQFIDGVSGVYGRGTNNEAELRAIGEGLAWAIGIGAAYQLRAAYSDSQLAVNLLTGKWACRAAHLRPHIGRIARILDETRVDIGWIPGSRIGIAHHLSRRERNSQRHPRVQGMAPPRGVFE